MNRKPKVVPRFKSEAAERKQRHRQAIARILERRKNAPTVTEEDIRAAREEGRS